MNRLLLFFALLSSYCSLYASSYMGNRVEFECINACTVRVTQSHFKSCSITAYLGPAMEQKAAPGCDTLTAIGPWVPIGSIPHWRPACPLVSTWCDFQSIVAVEEWRYYRDFDVCQGNLCPTEFSFNYCCRGALTSGAPLQTNFSSYLYTPQATCNSSPFYPHDLQFFFCNNEINGVDLGGIDPDGDSLAYTRVACMVDSNSSFAYSPGYSFQQPLGPGWQIDLYPATGVLTFTPVGTISGTESTVICIETKEYRNGQLIGRYVHDLEVGSWDCPATDPPEVSPFYNLSTSGQLIAPDTLQFSSNFPVSFDFNITETDSAYGASSYINWDQSIPGASYFDVNNPALQDSLEGNFFRSRFAWPNPVPGTYPIVFHLKDDRCPIFRRQDFVLHLVISGPSQFIAASGTVVDTCGADTLTLDASSVAGTYQWSTGATTPSISVTQPGSYAVTVTLPSGVQGLDTVEVLPIPIPQVTGQVATASQALVAFTPVYMVWHEPVTNSLFALDSTMTDAMGNYSFCQIPEDTIYIKAAPPLPFYPNLLPTYADTALFWNNAQFFLRNSAPVTAFPTVHAGINPGGPGFVGGLISQGANKTAGVGDPVPGISVFVRDLNSGSYHGHTTTDLNGYFSFANLPLGQYEIAVDAAGVDAVNVPVVNLTGQTPVLDSLDFRLHSSYLELVVPTALPAPKGGIQARVSPNPSAGTAYLMLEVPEEIRIEVGIWDGKGKQVGEMVDQRLGNGRHVLGLPELPAGIYFIQVRARGEVQVLKVVRQ